MIVALALHTLAALFWVGGMGFAYLVLRPSARALEPGVRLPLWHRVFSRFLPAVLAAIILLLASGFYMVVAGFGGFAAIGVYIQLMMGIGIIMVLIFLHLFFAPWRRFSRAVGAGDLPGAGRQLEQIRLLVATNLVLGIVTVVVGATGRYWG
jgi:uncharacterized membrane protein